MSIAGATDQPPLDSPATVNPTERSLADRIVWIDCEMTGLSLDADALIEVAALVTDYELNQLGDGVDIVIRPPAAALAQMDPFVRDMHTTAGLLAELDGPMLSSTLILPGESEPMTDGWTVKDTLDHQVDVVLDSGECGLEPTTVIDFSDGVAEVVRVGAGDPTRFEG